MIVDDGEPAVAIPPALQQVVTAYCLDGGDNPNNNSDQLHFAVILQAVAEKEVSLQDLVATTEKFLTSSVDMQRNKATSLLAELLHKVHAL